MNIIKKNGKVEEFKEKKIYTSILNSATDIGKSELNESDLKVLVSDIIRKISEIRKDGTPTSSYEVKGVIINVLLKDGFNEVCKSYIHFK
ncbi:ATP cone domain-containing protein [Clostridium vincentii]|uniref:Ribonucleotide-diphosphate reductase subunit alpha n=1 Tax=Clostridium vincentii TaxID=52704 RepID=A0A2T0BHQ7_9CLOT|nr:ATP cone domain-containing protein [Clostridium vincentii]PRR83426.1 ribonucleotide-diphosphate reductase subunit alpha [Clostridium vincentii]